MLKLTKENCRVKKAHSGNLYLEHPQFKVKLRFYASEEEFKEDSEWRERVSVRAGEEGSYYAVLAKHALEDLDV